MKRDDWSELATFAAIAEAGGFTRAAGQAGVSPSALSHAMRALEARLGVRLLNRTTRSVAPTEAGEQLLARLRPAMGEIEAALEALHARRDRPAGRVRVTAHRTAAVQLIAPRLAAFADAYPEVEIELVVDDGLVDLVAGRFDVGIRHEQTLERDMIAVRIGEAEAPVVAAAPSYFAGRSRPQTPDDLRHHRCLNYRYTSSGAVHLWEFERDGRGFAVAAPGRFVTNDVGVLMDAALAGVGLASLPRSLAQAHLGAGRLVPVLEGWAAPIPPDYLYYPSRRPSPAVQAFIDAMRAPSS